MRINRHTMFMEIARVVAKRSTCPRLNVGAVVVINNRPVSIGYNGAPAGEPQCDEVGCEMMGPACIRTVHAEVNALNYVPPSMRLRNKLIYVTDSPCLECAEYIIRASVSAVYYGQPYRDTAAIGELINAGVGVFRVVPSGYVITEKTGEIVL